MKNFMPVILAVFTVFIPVSADPLGVHKDVYWSYSGAAVPALARLVKPNLNIVWSTGSHTAQPVIISSMGPDRYTSELQGLRENTDIAKVVRKALKDGMDVVLVIGDGMGLSHLALPVMYNRAAGIKDKTAVEQWLAVGRMGMSLTSPSGELVTCSAASATAMATGIKTRNTMIGVDSNGYPLESVLEYAQKIGAATGIVTDKHVTDATPAAFYAKAASRSKETEISAQLAANGAIDIVLGGGAVNFIPAKTTVSESKSFTPPKTGSDKKSKRDDNRDLIGEMAGKGYVVVSSAKALEKAAGKKILGLFAGSNMNAAIDRDDENTGEPTLDAMASKALSHLKQNGKVFFLVLESGRIDAEAHKNDAGALLKAMLETDKMLQTCLDFRKGRENRTLLIFTADHETGGFGIASSYDTRPDTLRLASGELWKSTVNGVLPSALLTLHRQARSLEAIVSESGTIADLRLNLSKHTPFSISEEDAGAVLDLKKRK